MTKKKGQHFTGSLSPKEKLKHYEHMAEFWKNVSKRTSKCYSKKAEELRRELGLEEVVA